MLPGASVSVTVATGLDGRADGLGELEGDGDGEVAVRDGDGCGVAECVVAGGVYADGVYAGDVYAGTGATYDGRGERLSRGGLDDPCFRDAG